MAKVQAALGDLFVADDQRVELREQLEVADAAFRDAVTRMREAGKTQEEIAALSGFELTEIRSALRPAGERAAEPAEPTKTKAAKEPKAPPAKPGPKLAPPPPADPGAAEGQDGADGEKPADSSSAAVA